VAVAPVLDAGAVGGVTFAWRSRARSCGSAGRSPPRCGRSLRRARSWAAASSARAA
jgi:hypothetical protein